MLNGYVKLSESRTLPSLWWTNGNLPTEILELCMPEVDSYNNVKGLIRKELNWNLP